MEDFSRSYVGIFKADVKGMEWDLTVHWGEKNRVGQLLLEFHFWFRSPSLPHFLRDRMIPLELMGHFNHTFDPVAAKIEVFEVTLRNDDWTVDGTHCFNYVRGKPLCIISNYGIVSCNSM